MKKYRLWIEEHAKTIYEIEVPDGTSHEEAARLCVEGKGGKKSLGIISATVDKVEIVTPQDTTEKLEQFKSYAKN